MRCTSHCALVVLLLALLAPLASSLRVESMGVSSVVAPHSREKLEQIFSVTHDGDLSETISSISSGAMCQVYISYSLPPSPGLLATVRVVGDNAQFIQSHVTVSASNEQPGQLRISGDHNSDTPASSVGYIRVELEVHSPNQLQHLQSFGSGDVVLAASELFVNSPQGHLALELTGSGNMYLPPELSLLVQSLQVQSSGSGNLYLPTSDLSAVDVQVLARGSGDVKIAVSRQFRAASHVSLNSSGSSNCRIDLSDYQLPLLETSTTGSGDVTIGSVDTSSDAAVGQCNYRLEGSGELDAGRIVCFNAVVTSSGSGDTTLQVKGSFIYDIDGYADVRYAGAAPLSIASSTGKHSSSVKPLGHPPKTQVSWVKTYSLPRRRLSLVSMGLGFVNEIEEDDDDDDDDTPSLPVLDRTPLPTPGSTTKSNNPSIHTRSWLPVLIIVVVFIVWNRVEAWKRKQKRREEKAPLLGSEAPVYI